MGETTPQNSIIITNKNITANMHKPLTGMAIVHTGSSMKHVSYYHW